MMKEVDVLLKWTEVAAEKSSKLRMENAALMKRVMDINAEITSLMLFNNLGRMTVERKQYIATLKQKMEVLQERVNQYGIKLAILKSQRNTAATALQYLVLSNYESKR